MVASREPRIPSEVLAVMAKTAPQASAMPAATFRAGWVLAGRALAGDRRSGSRVPAAGLHR
ncbi:MAG: hypothetical protein ACRDSZ_01945 [Pseudonocardiaceae bacterium]